MSRPTTIDYPALVTLGANEGMFLAVNCAECEGGLVLEGATRGRQDMVRACREVKQLFYCPACRVRDLLTATFERIPGTRTPESRYTRG